MADQNKVSEFTGRKPGAANTEQQPEVGILGDDLGDFQRAPCGGCYHWKREPRMGLNQGTCMLFPPNPIPIQDGTGKLGQMRVRPLMLATEEGCDQFDDDSDDDTGLDVEAEVVATGKMTRIKAA